MPILAVTCFLLVASVTLPAWAENHLEPATIVSARDSLFAALLPISILLAAVALPFGILISRDNVRARRREIILSLETFFRNASKSADQNAPDIWSIIPSFEFVKSKYFGDKDTNKSKISRSVSFQFRYLFL